MTLKGINVDWKSAKCIIQMMLSLSPEIEAKIANLPVEQQEGFLDRAVENELLAIAFIERRKAVKDQLKDVYERAEEMKDISRAECFDRLDSLVDKFNS